jgi:hypothetical protein
MMCEAKSVPRTTDVALLPSSKINPQSTAEPSPFICRTLEGGPQLQYTYFGTPGHSAQAITVVQPVALMIHCNLVHPRQRLWVGAATTTQPHATLCVNLKILRLCLFELYFK